MKIESDHQDIDATASVPTLDFEAGRRAFIRSLGLGAAGVAVLGAAAGLPTPAAAQAITDTDILNFALNLEYLESEFYIRAAQGKGLSDSDVGGGTGTLGPVTGGRAVPFADQRIKYFADEISFDEFRHVQFLRNSLGAAKINRPAIDLTNSFTAAARAAGLVGSTGTFDAFANDNNWLLASFIFEDVGVTAYKGAARLLQSKDILEAAAGLLATEAYHAGAIRGFLYERGFFDQTSRIAQARQSLDGSNPQGYSDGGVGGATMANVANVDNNALAFSRTTRQVLNQVFLTANATSGGFFPNGVNGTIRS